MNAGLANLATLKAWLLAEAVRASADYDDMIAAIGKGVAGQIEKHCNRQLARIEDDTFDFSADRGHVALPRFPIEEVTKIELRTSMAEGFVDQGTVTDAIRNLSEAAGLVIFEAPLGAFIDRVRLTYTGGYFWETLEPDEESFPTAQPDGSAAVPDDLLLAWRLHSEAVWKVHDRLGLAIGEPGAGSASLLGLSLPGLDLNPEVLRLLQPFVRYVMT